jgi:hypothetical protein
MKEKSMQTLALIGISLFAIVPLQSTPKLVITIANPRSCSTLLLRSFGARGDFMVFNEPGLPIYYQGVTNPSKKPTLDYSKVLPNVLTQAETNNCFIKDMASSARNYVPQSEHLKDPSCYVIFLVRDPHHTILSWVKKCGIKGSRDSFRMSPEHLSYKPTYDLYEAVAQQAYNPPYIILAKDLIADPRTTLTKLCDSIDIPFTEACLYWEEVGSVTLFNDICHDKKSDDAILYWHDHAMHSTGFDSTHTYAVDHNGLPTFQEISNAALRAECKRMYHQNLIYYKKFVALHEQQVRDILMTRSLRP